MAGVLLALVVSASAATPAHSAYPKLAQPVIDNCNRQGNGSEITRRFPLSALRAAKHAMPENNEQRLYTHCYQAVKTAIVALAGPARNANAKQITHDCISDDGSLSYLYPLAALRKARHELTDELGLYTPCRGVIGTEIHMITGR